LDNKSWIRQYISSFLRGQNADALLDSFADEHGRMNDLTVAVTDSLTISTASGEYLDKRLSDLGITRPSELGVSDDAFRKLGIAINAQKQITDVIHTVLETFFGEETVRAMVQSTLPEPYALQDQDELWIELEDEEIFKIPFKSTDFVNINEASAQEVSDVITRYFRSQGIKAYATSYREITTRENYVRLFGSARGPYSMVRIQGGRAQTIISFPTVRPTELTNNDTIWQITRTTGSTFRFRWYGGSKPALNTLMPDDKALIYGPQFESTALISGTFVVTNIRPAGSLPSLTSGYFEVEIPDLAGLRSTPAGILPPANTLTDTYSYLITQAEYEDLKFFQPKKNTPYQQQRYALAFETASNLLKIYLPATTKVVKRDLIGSAHLHMLYDDTDFDSTFGSFLDGDQNRMVVVSDRAIKFHQDGYDNQGTGGTATFNTLVTPFTYTKAIDYVTRENGYTTVFFKETHGLTTIKWSPTANYVVDDEVYYNGAIYKALQNNGLLSTVKTPSNNLDYWEYVQPSLDYANATVTLDVGFVETDDPDNQYLGSYLVDPTAPYTLKNEHVASREMIRAGEQRRTVFCDGVIPNESGILLFGLNTDQQEGPVKYYGSQSVNTPAAVDIASASQNGYTITVVTTAPHGVTESSQVAIAGTSTIMDGVWEVSSVLTATTYQATSLTSGTASVSGVGTSTLLLGDSATTIILDPSYNFKYDHGIGTDISVLSSPQAYEPDPSGADYGFYITGTSEGRVFAEDLITQITALGIKLEIIVLYPGDRGLGNEQYDTDSTNPPVSDIVWVYGGDE
jgi:hypothetical protein